jgi:uncharacterized protein
VLIHGWEGSAESTYMLSIGEVLHRAGYSVARLNLRDHGGTQQLNEGLFHANRTGEVVGGVGAIAELVPHRRLFVLGFSLGGNFALRVGLCAPERGIAIDRIVAVNPALDPRRTMAAIDAHPLYRRYFVRRWKLSLRKKQQCFPELYDFAPLAERRTVRSVSHYVIPRYTPFATVPQYLESYTLSGERLSRLRVPTTILTAADDPIIAAGDFRALPAIAALGVEIQPHGGHCGYIQGPTLRSWLEARIPALLAPEMLATPTR